MGRAPLLRTLASLGLGCVVACSSKPPPAEPTAHASASALVPSAPTSPSADPRTAAPAAATRAPEPAAVATPTGPNRIIVHVIPLGDVPAETLNAVLAGMTANAPLEPRIHPALPLSAVTKAKKPGRYLAASMLDVLARAPDTDRGKVLGITEVDIVAEKDGNPEWGVLGLGSIDGKSCVLSTFRMRRKWDKGGATEAVVRDRLWKTAVHEVGHTLGLQHCPTQGCIMEDGHGTVATTDRETALCPRCMGLYARTLSR